MRRKEHECWASGGNENNLVISAYAYFTKSLLLKLVCVLNMHTVKFSFIDFKGKPQRLFQRPASMRFTVFQMVVKFWLK